MVDQLCMTLCTCAKAGTRVVLAVGPASLGTFLVGCDCCFATPQRQSQLPLARVLYGLSGSLRGVTEGCDGGSCWQGTSAMTELCLVKVTQPVASGRV